MNLLHLSDIHFQKPLCLQPQMDPDRHVRAALVNDAVKLLADIKADVDAILVSGDIAYQADPEEYQVAKEWLDEFANKIGCEPLNVFTVPGNHDVDRGVIRRDQTIQALRAHLAAVEYTNRSNRLFSLLDDDETGPKLMLPLDAYNQFAARYDCSTYLPAPFWQHDLALGSSHVLRLRGLNSVLISGPENDIKGSLFLGNIQTVFEHDENVVNVIIMHHPPDWLEDCDDVDDAINDGAKIHLVGHKHKNRISMDQNAVRLMASAVNPSRLEPNWDPGYNLISVEIKDDTKDVWLDITCHLRVWQASPDRFIAKLDNDDSSTWCARYRLGASVSEEEAPMEPSNEVTSAEETADVTKSTESRELVYRFWNLRPSQRRKIANELILLTTDDLSLPEFERYRRAFIKARDTSQIQALAGAISDAEDS